MDYMSHSVRHAALALSIAPPSLPPTNPLRTQSTCYTPPHPLLFPPPSPASLLPLPLPSPASMDQHHKERLRERIDKLTAKLEVDLNTIQLYRARFKVRVREKEKGGEGEEVDEKDDGGMDS